MSGTAKNRIIVYVATCFASASTRLLLFCACQCVCRTKSPNQWTASSATKAQSPLITSPQSFPVGVGLGQDWRVGVGSEGVSGSQRGASGGGYLSSGHQVCACIHPASAQTVQVSTSPQ